jgi:hypothetical protein
MQTRKMQNGMNSVGSRPSRKRRNAPMTISARLTQVNGDLSDEAIGLPTRGRTVPLTRRGSTSGEPRRSRKKEYISMHSDENRRLKTWVGITWTSLLVPFGYLLIEIKLIDNAPVIDDAIWMVGVLCACVMAAGLVFALISSVLALRALMTSGRSHRLLSFICLLFSIMPLLLAIGIFVGLKYGLIHIRE